MTDNDLRLLESGWCNMGANSVMPISNAVGRKLASEIRTLQAALAPFAAVGREIHPGLRDESQMMDGITIGNYRRAAEVSQ